MDQLATPAIWDLNKRTIACSTRFECHNYLTALYIRIMFLPLIFAWVWLIRTATQTHALLFFEKSYGTLHYATWVLRVLYSTRRGNQEGARGALAERIAFAFNQ